MSSAVHTQTQHARTDKTLTGISIYSDELRPVVNEAAHTSIPAWCRGGKKKNTKITRAQTDSPNSCFCSRPTLTDTPTLAIDNHNGQHVVFAQHHSSELVASNTEKIRRCNHRAPKTRSERKGERRKKRGRGAAK